MKRRPIQVGDRFRKNDLSRIVFEVIGTSSGGHPPAIRVREVGSSGDLRIYAPDALADPRQFVPLSDNVQEQTRHA